MHLTCKGSLCVSVYYMFYVALGIELRCAGAGASQQGGREKGDVVDVFVESVQALPAKMEALGSRMEAFLEKHTRRAAASPFANGARAAPGAGLQASQLRSRAAEIILVSF